MKKLLMFMCIILLVGCGGGGGSSDTESGDIVVTPMVSPIVGYVRDYDYGNNHNRVNVFITMGQSNSSGNTYNEDPTTVELNATNVFMTQEAVKDYPSSLTIIPFSSELIDRAYPRNNYIGTAVRSGHIANSATYFAHIYNSDIPLYVINISIGGTGVDYDSDLNLWSMNRADTDGKSLHPQTIHYLETFFNQLQAEGKEPYVVGLDWNQWENENDGLTQYEYFNNYMNFFENIDNVIPNSDYKLFICNPTSTLFPHRERVSSAYYDIQSVRGNVFIYKPDELNTDIYRYGDVHYNNATFEKIAEYIYSVSM